MRPFCHEDQTAAAYSRVGQTIVLKALVFTFSELVFMFLFKNPRERFALDVTLEIWSVQDKSIAFVMPR